MNQFIVARVLFLGLLLVAATRTVEAARITSAPFSIGLGYSANALFFDNTETVGVNTPTTIGGFSFNASASTNRWSSRGVTFDNRALADGPADNDYSANIDEALFQLPVTASYDGPAPSDVSGTPNYELRLEITNVSVYAGAHGSSTLKSMAWDETTPGHLATSPSIALPEGGWDFAEFYVPVRWNPADFNQPIGDLNTSYTRTFDILGGNGLRYGDGIEVRGRVHLFYHVPEPASWTLLAVIVGVVASGRFMRTEV